MRCTKTRPSYFSSRAKGHGSPLTPTIWQQCIHQIVADFSCSRAAEPNYPCRAWNANSLWSSSAVDEVQSGKILSFAFQLEHSWRHEAALDSVSIRFYSLFSLFVPVSSSLWPTMCNKTPNWLPCPAAHRWGRLLSCRHKSRVVVVCKLVKCCRLKAA